VGAWGVAGGTAAWLILNTFYYVVQPHITHGSVLRGHKSQWYLRDTLPYLAVGAACAATARAAAASLAVAETRLLVAGAGLVAGYAVSAALFRPTRGLLAAGKPVEVRAEQVPSRS
jgi:hypothetical protein